MNSRCPGGTPPPPYTGRPPPLSQILPSNIQYTVLGKIEKGGGGVSETPKTKK